MALSWGLQILDVHFAKSAQHILIKSCARRYHGSGMVVRFLGVLGIAHWS